MKGKKLKKLSKTIFVDDKIVYIEHLNKSIKKYLIQEVY
jgi:hypothetical protein